MLKTIIRRLSALAPTLPSVEGYNIPPIPKKKPVTIPKSNEKTGEVQAGKEWQTVWSNDGSVSAKIGSDNPTTPNLVTLDEYDQAFLTETIGAKWNKDEGRAKVMKWHWLRGESADAIEKYHTTTDGRLERGYGSRTAADFIKTYFAADDRREADGRKRQRTAPAPHPENTIEW